MLIFLELRRWREETDKTSYNKFIGRTEEVWGFFWKLKLTISNPIHPIVIIFFTTDDIYLYLISRNCHSFISIMLNKYLKLWQKWTQNKNIPVARFVYCAKSDWIFIILSQIIYDYHVFNEILPNHN